VILETRWNADEWPIVKAELRGGARTRRMVQLIKPSTER
jgi:hypothetical protein